MRSSPKSAITAAYDADLPALRVTAATIQRTNPGSSVFVENSSDAIPNTTSSVMAQSLWKSTGTMRSLYRAASRAATSRLVSTTVTSSQRSRLRNPKVLHKLRPHRLLLLGRMAVLRAQLHLATSLPPSRPRPMKNLSSCRTSGQSLTAGRILLSKSRYVRFNSSEV